MQQNMYNGGEGVRRKAGQEGGTTQCTLHSAKGVLARGWRQAPAAATTTSRARWQGETGCLCGGAMKRSVNRGGRGGGGDIKH